MSILSFYLFDSLEIYRDEVVGYRAAIYGVSSKSKIYDKLLGFLKIFTVVLFYTFL